MNLKNGLCGVFTLLSGVSRNTVLAVRQRVSVHRLRVAVQRQVHALPQRREEAQALAKGIAEKSAAWFNLVLSTDAAKSIDSWIRDTFASGSATIYDKAMDSTFISNLNGDAPQNVQEALGNIEPYYHRLFDGISNVATKGGHDLISAWEAVVNASAEDTLLQEVIGYSSAVAADLVTPMGLPVDTLERANFDKIFAAAQEHVGASKFLVADTLSYTATELFGASLGAVALVLKWKDKDLETFAAIATVLGVSTVFAGNPFLGIVAVVGLARTYQRARMEQEYGSVAHGIAKGGLSGGAFIAGAAALSAPVWGQLIMGIVCAVIAKKAYEAGRAKMDISWSDLTDFVVTMVKKRKPEDLLTLPMSS